MLPFKTYGFDNDTKTWINNVYATGGGVSYATAQAVNVFVESLKATNVWSKLDDIGLFCGNDLNSALTKLKSTPGLPPYLVNAGGFASGNYAERGPRAGLAGNGTGTYLETRLDSVGINEVADSFGIYVTYTGAAGAAFQGNGYNNNSITFELYTFSSGPAFGFAKGGNNKQSQTQVGTGWYMGAASGNNSGQMSAYLGYTNTGTFSLSAIDSGVPAQRLLLFARDNNGTAQEFVGATLGAYVYGKSLLTDADNSGIYSAMNQFQKALGRNP